MELSLSRSVQIYRGLRLATAVLLGVMFVQFGLSQDWVGNYEWLVYISAIVSTLWFNALIEGFLKFFGSEEEGSVNGLVSSLFLLVNGLMLFICLIGLIIRTETIQFLTGRPDLDYYSLFIIYIFFNTSSFLAEYLLIIQEEARKTIVYGILSFASQVIVCLIPLLYGLPLSYIFYGLIAVGLGRWLYSLYLGSAYFILDFKYVSVLVIFALPLLLNSLFSSLTKFADARFVSMLSSDDSTWAIYSFGARELPVNLILISTISSVFISRISKSMRNIPAMKLEVSKSMHILFPLAMVLMFASPYLFEFFYSEEYDLSAQIFNIYLLIVISRVMMTYPLVLTQLGANWLALGAFLEVLVNVFCSYILLQYYGLIGIAIGTVIAYTFEAVFSMLLLRYKRSIKLSQYLNLRIFTLYTILLIMTFLANIWITQN